MSQENVELVRSIFAAWECGDFGSAEWAHPEIEFTFADGLVSESWTGIDGMAESMRAFLSTWDEWHIEADDCRELDEERVLVLSAFTGRGKASGLEVGQMRAKGAHVFHVRGGRVVRLVAYMDRDQALEAVGLRE